MCGIELAVCSEAGEVSVVLEGNDEDNRNMLTI